MPPTARTIALLIISIAACSSQPASHGLSESGARFDPLDEGELETAVQVLRSDGKLSAGVSIVTVALEEPPKSNTLEDRSDAPRRALAVLQDRPAHRTIEARVDLTQRTLVDWKEVPDAEPMLMSDEFAIVAKLVRADERWRKAMRRRGIEDFDRVYLDVWSPGAPLPRDPSGVRLLRALSNLQGTQKNAYGPPIEGVIATVDMTHERVVDVTDTGIITLSQTSTDFYDPRVRGEDRAPPAALHLAHPSETSIEAAGHELRWQKWRMRWSMDPREGLVLHEIGYEDGGRIRSILYRASISEMWVPYGDPAETWVWRNAFDEGEYGLGLLANTLVPGRDVPQNVLLGDAAFVTSSGDIAPRSGVVAAYERAGGLAWSHRDGAAGTEARRATELVLSFFVTAGNYDYGFNWIFHQDGTIAFEMDLTGILLTKGAEEVRCQLCRGPVVDSGSRLPQGDEAYGTLVADHVVAPNHQHFVSLRLDFDIDGTRNRVKEMNVKRQSAAPNNHGVVVEQTFFRRERDARRDASLVDHREWKVYNADVKNKSGHATGYVIEPEGNAVSYLGRATRERRLAGFVDHHLWVTHHHDRELFAAGDYPAQGGRPGGLPVWSNDDESIEDEDLVVWYTLGVTHVPRPEDYPVMPVQHAGVKLVPHGFFDRNPALDLP